jgi:uncharacterized repeat protein (TIGR03806 family)
MAKGLSAALALGIVAVALFAQAPTVIWQTTGDPFDVPDGFAQQLVAEGLTGATGMTIASDGRIFVCEQTGALRIVKDDVLLSEPFVRLDVDSSWERGLLGVTLDPKFATNGHVYVLYVAAKPYPHHRVSRFTAQGDRAAAGSETVLLEGDDQRKLGGSVPSGHQGGGLRFGKDGKLYVALGEQTNSDAAQRLDTLQGKLLRINPDGSIPPDNPFFTKLPGKYRAVWAYGLRNPFGLAVQPGTGRMFINDVGGSRFEEINEAAAGANYGWPASEGPTDRPGHRAPLFAYSEAAAQAITGGAFYNPARPQFPAPYRGKYFFADYTLGWVKVLDPDQPRQPETFATGLAGPVALEVDADGNLYVLCRNAWVKDGQFRPQTGSLHRVFHAAAAGRPVPTVAAPPRDVTALAGGAATFRVEAAGEGPLRYRWQRDGRWLPGADGPAYVLPKVSAADHAATFQCVVSNRAGTVRTRPAILCVVTPRPAEAPAGLAGGLAYEYHEGHWAYLPALMAATRVTAGTADHPGVEPRQRGHDFGLSFRGYLTVDQEGVYTFTLHASGAAKLLVGGADVATVGLHNGPRKVRGAVGLKAGKHALRLDYAHGQGMPVLELTCAGPDGQDTVIPASRWSHADPAPVPNAAGRAPVMALNVPARPEDLPKLLSETGIFRSLEALAPEAGLLPYEVNTPLWSDGIDKWRWLALLAGMKIGFAEHGAWRFPAGTVFVKHFALPETKAGRGRRLETRLLVVGAAGRGYGVTYRWRDDQKDAELLPDGLTEEVRVETPKGPRTQKWTYPSRQQCLICHTAAAGFVLGVNTRQLNRTCGGAAENQLLAWGRLGLFEAPPAAADPVKLPRLFAVTDEQAPLAERVRSYLDANCSQCHRPGGVRAPFDARFEVPLAKQNLLGTALLAADLGVLGARVVVPGDRARSMLYQRMRRRQDVFDMPPLATHLVDEQAVELVGRWIDGLKR